MSKISFIISAIFCVFTADVSALANAEALIKDPRPISFQHLFCGPNSLSNPARALEIASVCWVRSTQPMGDLDYLEGLEIKFHNGEIYTYHLSEFIFDTQLSRASHSQILRGTVRGQSLEHGFAVGDVYKEFSASSRLTHEDRPLRVFGRLPSGHRFLIQRDLLP